MSHSSSKFGILSCPGLKVTANAGVSWTDSSKRVHDLIATRMMTIEEVAADHRMIEMGFGSYEAVRELMLGARLYPVFRKNSRVVRVYACAIEDFRSRAISGKPIAHLAQTRAQKVA